MSTEATCLFGTAGWSYKDWDGTIYPSKKPAGFNHLKFLAEEKAMQFVEVNTSFYHIPSPKLTSSWVQKTEGLTGFTFWMKLHQQFTHQRKVIPADVLAFTAALEPLQQAGKLSGLLAQFPYSFKLNTGNLNYTLALATLFQAYPLALEFRHQSWNRQEFFALLKEKNLIWVNIDQPQVSLSLPLTATMTHREISYVRLHGRNEANWFADNGRDARYDYDYKALDLDQIMHKIKELAALAKTIFVSGNNHYKGNAVKNLLELKKKLQLE